MADTETFEGWVILELMGHRKMSGFLREQQIGGASFLRLDITDENDVALGTQFYSPSAVYCITPTTEVMAKAYAARGFEGPLTRWELPRQLVEGRISYGTGSNDPDYDDDDDPDDERPIYQ